MSWEVGASCTDCAVFADVYHDTMRWVALAPTPRTIAEDVAGACAPAMVIEPMPNAAEAARTATPAIVAGRLLADFIVQLEGFTDVPSLCRYENANGPRRSFPRPTCRDVKS